MESQDISPPDETMNSESTPEPENAPEESDVKDETIAGYEFPLADSISTTTLVNILLRKGILSEEELLAEESKTLQTEHPQEEFTRVRVRRTRSTKWKRLKHFMSRRRWTRTKYLLSGNRPDSKE